MVWCAIAFSHYPAPWLPGRKQPRGKERGRREQWQGLNPMRPALCTWVVGLVSGAGVRPATHPRLVLLAGPRPHLVLVLLQPLAQRGQHYLGRRLVGVACGPGPVGRE